MSFQINNKFNKNHHVHKNHLKKYLKIKILWNATIPAIPKCLKDQARIKKTILPLSDITLRILLAQMVYDALQSECLLLKNSLLKEIVCILSPG